MPNGIQPCQRSEAVDIRLGTKICRVKSVRPFFKREEDERKRVMGDYKHYDLDTLATHPDYQRRGAGSMLMKWGCDLADKNRVGAYVDASKAGAPLYERFGFVDESEPDASEVASMARRQRD
ncbi:N-acetyltransferase domain-containing protein [Fusarium sp. LHS14.1]|nr:N-acetyltransferase domain-containing protein [Fusarium sp. LHS14.1]